MDSRIIIYTIICLSFLESAASLITLNIYLIGFCSATSIIIIFTYKLWDVIEAIIIKKTNIVQLIGNYELEANRFTATRGFAKCFSATAAAVLNDSPTKEISRENIERIISSSNSPFRLVVQAERLDSGKILDNLKTRRRMKEIELSKSKSNPQKFELNGKMLERELDLIEGEIKTINSGATPLKASIYLITSAIADSKFIAEERAMAQSKELSGEFSAVLGASFETVSGSELVRLLSIDSACAPV